MDADSSVVSDSSGRPVGGKDRGGPAKGLLSSTKAAYDMTSDVPEPLYEGGSRPAADLEEDGASDLPFAFSSTEIDYSRSLSASPSSSSYAFQSRVRSTSSRLAQQQQQQQQQEEDRRAMNRPRKNTWSTLASLGGTTTSSDDNDEEYERDDGLEDGGEFGFSYSPPSSFGISFGSEASPSNSRGMSFLRAVRNSEEEEERNGNGGEVARKWKGKGKATEEDLDHDDYFGAGYDGGSMGKGWNWDYEIGSGSSSGAFGPGSKLSSPGPLSPSSLDLSEGRVGSSEEREQAPKFVIGYGEDVYGSGSEKGGRFGAPIERDLERTPHIRVKELDADGVERVVDEDNNGRDGLGEDFTRFRHGHQRLSTIHSDAGDGAFDEPARRSRLYEDGDGRDAAIGEEMEERKVEIEVSPALTHTSTFHTAVDTNPPSPNLGADGQQMDSVWPDETRAPPRGDGGVRPHSLSRFLHLSSSSSPFSNQRAVTSAGSSKTNLPSALASPAETGSGALTPDNSKPGRSRDYFTSEHSDGSTNHNPGRSLFMGRFRSKSSKVVAAAYDEPTMAELLRGYEVGGGGGDRRGGGLTPLTPIEDSSPSRRQDGGRRSNPFNRSFDNLSNLSLSSSVFSAPAFLRGVRKGPRRKASFLSMSSEIDARNGTRGEEDGLVPAVSDARNGQGSARGQGSGGFNRFARSDPSSPAASRISFAQGLGSDHAMVAGKGKGWKGKAKMMGSKLLLRRASQISVRRDAGIDVVDGPAPTVVGERSTPGSPEQVAAASSAPGAPEAPATNASLPTPSSRSEVDEVQHVGPSIHRLVNRSATVNYLVSSRPAEDVLSAVPPQADPQHEPVSASPESKAVDLPSCDSPLLMPGSLPSTSHYASRRIPARSFSAPLANQTGGAPTVMSLGEDGKPKVDLFDLTLPREIRLLILGTLVTICEEAHEDRLGKGLWTARLAREARWVGRLQGIRELVKVSRVSKTWLHLAFDGQLWQDLDLALVGNDVLSTSGILRIAESAGPFLRKMNLRGLANLPSTALVAVADACLKVGNDGVRATRLTHLDLTGCRSISTSSLHYLLARSPHLVSIRFQALRAVTSSTCSVIAGTVRCLEEINLSRCPNIEASSICQLKPDLDSSSTLCTLRIAGLKNMSDEIVGDIAERFPELEVLDLSHSRELTDEAMYYFTSVRHDHDPVVNVSHLGHNTSRNEIRRVTRLRQLSISGCRRLTDKACEALVFACPKLEILELASIGAGLKDQGVVSLLKTTPLLRKLDLEDANELTDRVLAVITPPAPRPNTTQTGTGAVLEHLILSYVSNVTDAALLLVIKNCSRLGQLEVDNTGVGDAVIREFIQTRRAREMKGASVGAVDCRTVGRQVIQETAQLTRPRRGYRAWWARSLNYRDDDISSVRSRGLIECDDSRVVVHAFYAWAALDEAERADRRRSAARSVNLGRGSNGTAGPSTTTTTGGQGRARSTSDVGEGGRRTRWISMARLVRASQVDDAESDDGAGDDDPQGSCVIV